MPTISPRWNDNGQLQEQGAWCWAATTSMMRASFGGGALPQARIVHDWLMSETAEPGERTDNYRAWITSFDIQPTTWDNVANAVGNSPAATELMNGAYGNSLPGVAIEYTDLGGKSLEDIAQLLDAGGLYVIGSNEHWQTLYGVDTDQGKLLVWDPLRGAVTYDLDWLQGMAAFSVTGYNEP